MRRVRTDERGIALPITMMMIVVALLFSGAAIGSVMQGLRQSGNDVGRKKAAAAAQSGLRMGVFRLNQTKLDAGTALRIPLTLSQCLVQLPSLNLGVVNLNNGWCASQSYDLGDGTTYQVQTSAAVDLFNRGSLTISLTPLAVSLQRRIVATGISQGERRRFYMEVQALGEIRGTVIPLVGTIVSRLTLQLYRTVPNSLRECTPTPPTPSNPASGC
jgi:Tfp pilus assembly protein PilX